MPKSKKDTQPQHVDVSDAEVYIDGCIAQTAFSEWPVHDEAAADVTHLQTLRSIDDTMDTRRDIVRIARFAHGVMTSHQQHDSHVRMRIAIRLPPNDADTAESCRRCMHLLRVCLRKLVPVASFADYLHFVRYYLSGKQNPQFLSTLQRYTFIFVDAHLLPIVPAKTT